MANYSEGLYIVLNTANEIKAKYNLNYVGTEEILYAFLLTPKCDATKALLLHGATYERYFAYLKTTFRNQATSGYTVNAKNVLKDASEIAKEYNDYVKTAHLLLAILKCENCRAYKILQALGVDIASLYSEVLKSVNVKKKKVVEKEVTAPIKEEKREVSVKTPTLVKPKEELKKQETSLSSAFDGLGYDLTLKAKQGKIDDIIGREQETQKIIVTLSRKTKNAPVLVGEAGVGKSAVVEGLALKIAKGIVPDFLKGKTIFSLDVGGLLAGTRYRGDFELKLKNAVDYAVNEGNIIFFIDEIHNLVGAGSTQDSKVDAVEILKPLLSRGEIMVIGATTPNEYAKYIEKDPALERRFQPIKVEEPSVDEAIEIIRGIKNLFEKHHCVTILDEAVISACKLSSRYIIDRKLPDKAIDLLDEACSEKHLLKKGDNGSIEELKLYINSLILKRDNALKRNDLDVARNADKEIYNKKQEYQKLLSIKNEQSLKPLVVTTEDIKKVISESLKIPVTKLSLNETSKLLGLEEELKKMVVGQEDAVNAVSRAVRRSRANLKDPCRPMGSFIFVGPTGVGKSHLTKALGKCVFGSEQNVIRFDMSEYSDKTSINKLIGVAQGYVGYEEEGLLTEKIRKNPYSVVLFDEIEKAHPDIFDLLLQVLDEGRLTDSKGKEASFKNALIILTSNVGFSSDESQVVSFGFTNEIKNDKNTAIESLKKRFKPEFINRLDEIIVFNRLSKENFYKIARILVGEIVQRVKEMHVNLNVEDAVLDVVVSEGYDKTYGARPLKRAVSKHIEDLLSDAIIEGKIKEGDTVTLYSQNGSVLYKKD